MKKLYHILLIVAIGISACSEEDLNNKNPSIRWNTYGLDNQIINRLQVFQNTLYAATNQGFFKRGENGQPWISLGLDDKSCQTFLLFGQEEYLVSIFDASNPSEATLMRTTDGGTTWQEARNGFGGNDPEPAFSLAFNPDDPDQLYATGYDVVAASDDRGASWQPVYGNWGGFASGLSIVEVNPNDTDQVWAGGQNAIEQSVTLMSPDGGSTWQSWQGLVEAPSVTKAISFHPQKPEIVFGGFEGGLIKTTDKGQNWQTLIDSEDNRFFFGIQVHPQNPEVIYAAGWLKRFDEPQPLKVFRTADGGQSWNTYEYQQQIFGGVYSMDLVATNQQDILYLGLYNGGVYQFEYQY